MQICKYKKQACQACFFMAGTKGLEPSTFCVTGRRSNQLSYAPIFFNFSFPQPDFQYFSLSLASFLSLHFSIILKEKFPLFFVDFVLPLLCSCILRSTLFVMPTYILFSKYKAYMVYITNNYDFSRRSLPAGRQVTN